MRRRGSTYIVNKGDIVTVYNEGHPRDLWRTGKIESLVSGADSVVRGVLVKVMLKKGHPKLLHRPLQHIYPLEVHCEPTAENSPGATQTAEPDGADDPPL